MEEFLQKIKGGEKGVIYEIKGDDSKNRIKRYVISTPSTREICTNANYAGKEYRSKLREGIVTSLNLIPEKNDFIKVPDSRFNILNLLTGSDAWKVVEALEDAYSLNAITKSFIWTKRFKDNGLWKVNLYNKKIQTGKNMNFVFADIVAKGASLKGTLPEITREYKESNSSIDNVLFFTIGGEEAEKNIANFVEENNANGIVVYIEGRFLIAGDNTSVRIKTEGTDMLAKDCLVAPEFLIEDYQNLFFTLEKCRAYYGSSRDHKLIEHYNDLLEYWSAEKQLASNGFTLYEALSERSYLSPTITKNQFYNLSDKIWIGTDKNKLNLLWKLHSERWHPNKIERYTDDALREICSKRIDEISEMLKKH